MFNTHLFRIAFALVLAAPLFQGCSSTVEKANIPATANPSEEISKLDRDLKSAQLQNFDVLAAKEFKQSQRYLEDAKESVQQSESQADILDALRTSRGWLQKAESLSEDRAPKAVGLLAARQMALKAGVTDHSDLRSDWTDLDEEVSAKAEALEKMDAAEIADWQQQYVTLERRAVVQNQLGKAQAMTNGAEKNGAAKKAPASFKKAQLSLKTAESMISTNVRNPQGFQPAVTKANQDAVQLLAVLKTIEQNGERLPESAAIKMVAQSGQISNLTTDLNAVESAGSALQARNERLSSNIANANTKVAIQKALENARAQFSKNEAEAYQQGDTLVIRLKQVNFASGRSDLPANSLPLLAKVSEVAKSLNASQIVVEGHTDSTGSASANKSISNDRADAVASYLKTNGFEETKIEAEGFGFQKPIATNKSAEGRAQNRRVDIIITPESVQ